ncbi:MAG: ABC transporter ATP-binding protein [Bacteroidia bacterium]
MFRLFTYLKSYTNKVSVAISSSILNKLFDLMPPIMTGWLVDVLANTPPAWMPGNDMWDQVMRIILIIVVVFSLESLFEWIFQKSFFRLAQEVQHDLRMDSYRHIQSRSLSYFEKSRLGNLLTLLNDDINQLERFLNSGFNEILHLVIVIIFGGLALFLESWQLAVVGILPIPFIIWSSLYYERKVSPHYQSVRNAAGELNTRLENNLAGIREIKSFATEQYEYKRVHKVSDMFRLANFGAIRLSAAYVPLIRIFITLGYGGGMLLGAWWLIQGEYGITLGTITFFAMMIQRLLWPITRLGRIFDDYARAKASAKRVFDLLDNNEALPITEAAETDKEIQGNIELKGVAFSYQEDLPMIKDLNLSIKAGQTIGIAGPTGAGKTSLIKLLLRYYDVTDGAIMLEGIDIRDWDIETMRKNIAFVSQETYLFHGTIRENIAYGKSDSSQEAIEDAARQAALHDFVVSLPEGYETIVGERGMRLSGGQRQRLSIARAILKNAPILLLDEATASVDSETERVIQENLDALSAGRTAILIAHRLSTLAKADTIVVLDRGTVVEQGDHEALLAKGGVYTSLWKNLQSSRP